MLVECQKVHPAEQSHHAGMHKTHTYAHLKHLPAASVHLCVTSPSDPDPVLKPSIQFQLALFPPLHSNSQAATAAMPQVLVLPHALG